mgnify:FL=1
MPTVTLPDGTNVFIDSNDPKEIERQKENYRKQKLSAASGSSTLGDVARAFPAAGVSAVQGVATIPTTGIDLLFNTEVTDSVNDFFESVKPEVEGTAGKTVQTVLQFGVPGFAVTKALSGLSKARQLAAIGAVDAAVATDDIDTFADLIFDKESDEERIKNLEGREAALARLKERLQVFAETSTFVYGAPKVVGGAVGLAGGGLDLAAPYFNALAKGLNNKTGGIAAAEKADKGVFDFLRKNFTYGGKYEQTAKNNEAISNAHQAQKTYATQLTLGVGESMDKIQKTVQEAVSNGGALNQTDALDLVKAITSYRAPLFVVEREFPSLSGTAKRSKMEQIEAEALKKIKSFEGSGNKIDYEELGIDSSNHVSTILVDNKGLFQQNEALLSKLVEGKSSIPGLTLEPGFKEALILNNGMYGTTLYRGILDPDFKPAPDVYENAINQIQEIFDLQGKTGRSKATQIFDDIRNPSNLSQTYETPELYVNNIKSGLLKGKTLKDLPAVREALGEITPLNYKEGSEWKSALMDEAFATTATMSKVATLIGDIKYFDDIKEINDLAIQRGTTPFLRTAKDLEDAKVNTLKEDGSLRETLEAQSPNTGDVIEYAKFDNMSGALKDTYAPKIFVDAVQGASKDFIGFLPDILRNTYKGLLGLKTVGQYNKTLLSISAHIRNNTSAPIFAAMNGNLGPSANFTKTFKEVFAGVIDPRNKTKYQEQIKEAREYDVVVGRSVQLEEITDLASYASEDVALMKKLQSNGLVDRVQKSVLKPIERLYTGADNAARLLNWNGEQAKLLSAIDNSLDDAVIPVNAIKNFSDPDIQKLIQREADDQLGAVVKVGQLKKLSQEIIEQQTKDGVKNPKNLLDKFVKGEAANIALDVTPTYSRVPEIVKTLKFIPVFGNFSSFPAEIFRNTGNTIQRSIKELASSNPELQKIGMKRITSALATTTAIPAGLVAAGTALTGSSQEQIDAYKRSFAAPWEKTATLIPIETDANGNITSFINYSYTNPYDTLQRPIKAIINAYQNGVKDEASLGKIAFDSSFDSIAEITDPFLSPSLSAAAVAEGFVGKTQTGKIIWNESDPLGEKIMKGQAHIFNSIAPTALPITIQTDAEGTKFVPKDFITAAGSLVTGEDDLISPKGRPIDVGETMLQAFTGIKAVKPQLEKSLYYRAAESKRAIRETTNEFNRLLRSNSEQDAETFVQGYINTNENRYTSLRDLYNAIEDARALGLTETEIRRQLKVAKVADRSLVMRGIFKPMDVNPEVLQFARRATEGKARQPVPTAELSGLRRDLRQGLQGQFIKPGVQSTSPSTTRASDVLRQEELNKILTGKP